MYKISPTISGLTAALENNDREFCRKLLSEAGTLRDRTVGGKVYLRGLLEISSICRKDCFYCGIRCSNGNASRYTLSDEEIISASQFAFKEGYGSICIQSGERCDSDFTSRISRLVRAIKDISDGSLGITLSLGEQSYDTLLEWFEAGAHRYLIRIETSNPDLYARLHPQDALHSFDRRLNVLQDLRSIGFQVGSGVMIGLPFQSCRDLAGDLLFLKEFDIDMVGMGPYIPHPGTPLGKECLSALSIPTAEERLSLSLKMVALLRLLMPDINIAATTALEVLDPRGREKAIAAGANIVMPNISPARVRAGYDLYEGKRNLTESPALGEIEIGYNQWGDSLRFKSRV
ncbi:MAG: [FeFe] hydrogenase H-cluster radical SAM maturase HydE [Bacteroidales bacterium]|nr:[FeFe] hydrogenase H-cluster radical SAM maturase HydE [Candidatus Cacconaster caballi]